MDPNKPTMAPPPYPTQPGMGMPDPYGTNYGGGNFQPGGGAPYPTQGAPPYPTQGAPPYAPQAPYPQQGPYPPQPAGYNPNMQQAGVMGAQSGMVRQYMPGGYDSDAEGGAQYAQNGMGNAFGDKAVRRGFIKKVYGILMCQLTLTGAFICVFTFVEPVREYSRRSTWLYWVAFAVMLVCLISMACCEGVRRKAPTNFIFLFIFTAAEGFMLGTMTARFNADAILIAVGITAAVSLALTLFAFQTKYDFTTCGGMMCALLVILMVAGIIMAFMPYNKYAMIGYGSAGALIFSMYIVYDTQLMMGGKHKYSLDPEEYVFASLNLYLDIINLFLYILMIVGATSSD